jgi:hypothetical protein
MEIQTFFLTKQIEQIGTGSNYNAQLIGAHNFFPLDGAFPLNFRMPYYLLLRRTTRESSEATTLRFKLTDMSGNSIGQPRDIKAEGIFPKGHKFLILTGTIEFLFPAPGDYSLKIIADEEKLPSVFSYDVEITEQQK